MTQFAFTQDIANHAPDMNEATKGGARELPAEGMARLRLISYIEYGQHTSTSGISKGKVQDKAVLTFELHGPKYPVTVTESGEKIPFRLSVYLNKSLNEKAIYYKLFKRLNWEGKATHFAQLLGKPFIGNVKHYVGEQTKEKSANLRDEDGNLTIRPPRLEQMNPETGEPEPVTVAVPEAVSPLRMFIWDAKVEWLPEMWESLYIETDKKDGGPLQALVLSAENLAGSPLEQWLKTKGVDLGVPKATNLTKPKDDASDDDVLNGVA